MGKKLEQAVKDIAAMRGKMEFEDAILPVEAELASADPRDDLLVNLRLEGFGAALEAGLPDQARKYARAVAETDPEMPSIQPYL